MTRNLLAASCAVLLLATSFVAHSMEPAQVGKAFKPDCTLVFDAIKKKHPIDESCGPDGDTEGDAHREQNRAKNNFCAEGKALPVTINTFVKLQRAAEDSEIPFGSSNSLPPDRSVLKDLSTNPQGKKVGEGTVVSIAAFVIDARHSNLSKGESNNCKHGGKENNDIHIELGRTSDDDPCTGITAEISPHFRPVSWDRFDVRP